MQLFRQKTQIDFLGLRHRFFVISGLLLGTSLVSLAVWGVKYSIDFTGGTTVQVTFNQPVEVQEVRAAIEKAGMSNAVLQHYTDTNTFLIRIQADVQRSAQDLETQLQAIQAALPTTQMRIDSKSYVGPSVASHLFRQALLAVVLSLAGIVAYVGFRFANPIWGVAHIIALLHTLIATLGLFSLLGTDIDLLIISAILTVGGYSIHDTIVIFDRMREKLHVLRKQPLAEVMNQSMNETLSRTVITSFIVFVVVSVLYVVGGPLIHHFAMAMVFGTLVGTYSSIAVAAPLVYEWEKSRARR
jgi:preprotein translocase subunit SecF